MHDFISDPAHAWIAAVAVLAAVPTFGVFIGLIFLVHDRRAQARAERIEASVAAVNAFHARVATQLNRVERESKQRDEDLGRRIDAMRPARASGN